uniref:Uncharacterized protein n=1 Tax=Opuntia streptacantha TaxID=393608 RepID=A0A7C9FJW6_OPUST
MQAMPFNLQETVSGEREFEEFQVPISNSTTKLTIEGDSKSSPVDSEPTSTLDSTPSPSPPTLSSSSENAAVLAHPHQLHHGSDNVDVGTGCYIMSPAAAAVVAVGRRRLDSKRGTACFQMGMEPYSLGSWGKVMIWVWV